jgi:uncharacterized protein (UPF0335 family)
MPRKPKSSDTAAGIGHNSVDRERLRGLVDRIEALEAEKAELAADIRDVYAEAKSAGYDVAALRHVIRLRKQDKTERDERQQLVDEYMSALGDYATTPLGKAALERAELTPPV